MAVNYRSIVLWKFNELKILIEILFRDQRKFANHVLPVGEIFLPRFAKSVLSRISNALFYSLSSSLQFSALFPRNEAKYDRVTIALRSAIADPHAIIFILLRAG